MKKNLITFLIGVAVGLIITFSVMKSKIEYIEVPVEVEIEVPIIEKVFEPVYRPFPVKGDTTIDSIYYDRYKALKDSVARDSMYQEAIKIRSYNERVEDDNITLSLEATVRGELLDYKLGYKTKPRTILLDTVLSIPIPRQSKIYGGGTIYLPPANSNLKSSIIPTILYENKKSTIIYSGGYDVVNKAYTVGAFIRF